MFYQCVNFLSLNNFISVDLFLLHGIGDTAKGVIGHPAPMEKYELIPPLADPLESYLSENKKHWGTNPVKRPPYSGLQSPHGNTSGKGRYRPPGAQ